MLADTDEPVGLVTEMSGFAIITRAANRHGQYSKDRYDKKLRVELVAELGWRQFVLRLEVVVEGGDA